MTRIVAATLCAFCLAWAPQVRAQEAGGQSLDQAASDPTAALMSFQLQAFRDTRLHNLDDATASRLQFRAAIPFRLGETSNIARLTLPYITDSPSGTEGYSDATVFILTTFDRSWGRWGAGAVALLPTGSLGLSAEKWALGPALGFTVQSEKLLWGAFNQNLITIDGDKDRPDVNISTVQPILNLGLGDGWSVGLSEMVITYDWDEGGFTSLPLGVKLSRLSRVGGLPVQLTASYEHNFYDEGVATAQTFSLTVKLLMPKG